MLCVGAAFSKGDILGPYIDIGEPLYRNASVGNIDPTYFEDPVLGNFLIWKEDGNGRIPPEKYTPIWAQQLSEDGLSFYPGSQKVDILQNDPNSWEGPLVEAPWMISRGGMYANTLAL
jgi:hypothetical protein